MLTVAHNSHRDRRECLHKLGCLRFAGEVLAAISGAANHPCTNLSLLELAPGQEALCWSVCAVETVIDLDSPQRTLHRQIRSTTQVRLVAVWWLWCYAS